MTLVQEISTAVSVWAAVCFGIRALVRRRWPSKPINFVNGVLMPAVVDSRWTCVGSGRVVLRGTAITANFVVGGFSDHHCYIQVDDVRWTGWDAERYAWAVVRRAQKAHEERNMEQSREVARRAARTP